MILTTTNEIIGHEITEYLALVMGECMLSIPMDFSLFDRGHPGGERVTQKATKNALDELEQRAILAGADAVVGMRIDFGTFGKDNHRLMIVATGTAVKLG